jgi:hypothetical protein
MKIFLKYTFVLIAFLALILTPDTLLSQKKSTTESPVIINYQTLNPEKLSADIPLKNPGIGIEQASLLESRNGKTVPVRNGTVGPRNTSLDGAAAIRYIRSDWVSLEPADNQFHWATLEANINHAWSVGQQIGFSINTASPVLGGNGSYWQNVPAWFIEDPRHVQCTSPNSPAGCTYYIVNFTNCSSVGTGADCTENWIVNNDDAEYIRQQVEMIDSIRVRYDNPQWAAKWAYLDMRNWGVWGEWQTDEARISGTTTRWPHPSLENKKAIIDAFLKFEHIPVIANYHDEVSWVYAVTEGHALGKTVGWRTDGIDVTAWKINPAITNYPVIRDAWKHGPIYGEVMGSSISNELMVDNVLPRAYLWRMSGFNNKYENKYSSDIPYRDAVNQFRAKGGYRLAMEDVTIPVQVPKNQNFTITTRLINTGTAPMYRDYYDLSAKLSPVSGGNDIIIKLDGKVKGLLPDSIRSFSSELLADMPVGDYNVSIGITGDAQFNPLPPPVTLANSASVISGLTHWCPVGTLNITFPVSVNDLIIHKFPSESEITKVYNMYGSIVKVLPAGQQIDEWLSSAELTPGIYLIRNNQYVSKKFIGLR